MDVMYIALIVLFPVIIEAKLPAQGLIKSLILSEDNFKEAFNGLDVKKDGVINMEDLNSLLYHKEAEFAKTKFLEMIDISKRDQLVDEEELNLFLNKQSVTKAVHECVYVHSKSLREYCFCDQMLTYVVLVIDYGTVEKVFREMEDIHDGDDDISPREVQNLVELDKRFLPVYQLNFMTEIGGDDNLITLHELAEYMFQEDLHDGFRSCRNKLEGCIPTYNIKCLIKELMEYTMFYLTDLDIATTFNDFEHTDDKVLTKEDLVKADTCSDAVAERFVKLMDATGDKKVTFGEFRTYLREHTVLLQLEKDCSEKESVQSAQIACYKEKITNLAVENYTPVWLRVGDLDMVFVFEDLDVNDDGRIKATEDLVFGKLWRPEVASKMVEEMDYDNDAEKSIRLEEFYDYVGWPNMVFGLADCMALKRGQDRVDCYVIELKDIIINMLEKKEVEDFFDFYDVDKNKRITTFELEKAQVTGDEADNFINELGMGDKEINYNKFKWFTRQQELSRMYPKKGKTMKGLHVELLNYLANRVTEYDTQQLFSLLDTDKNWELECSDFGPDNQDLVLSLLKRMDFDDSDNTVNFVEFWLYLNTPIGSARKQQLEKLCTKTQKTQAEELKCYKREIVNVE